MVTTIEKLYMDRMKKVSEMHFKGKISRTNAIKRIFELEAEAYQKYPQYCEPDGNVTHMCAELHEDFVKGIERITA